jgi:hypothetical protein
MVERTMIDDALIDIFCHFGSLKWHDEPWLGRSVLRSHTGSRFVMECASLQAVRKSPSNQLLST